METVTNQRTFRVVVTSDNGTVVFSEQVVVPWTEGEHERYPARRALEDVAAQVRAGVL